MSFSHPRGKKDNFGAKRAESTEETSFFDREKKSTRKGRQLLSNAAIGVQSDLLPLFATALPFFSKANSVFDDFY